MDDKKQVLKERFHEVKNQLLANSKDVHWAKNAIDELVSLKGQLDHEETLVYLPKKNVEDIVSNDTFELAVMKDGTAIYKTFGGYTVIANANLVSLNDKITEFVRLNKELDDTTEEEKENIELDLAAFGYILSLPTFVFSDVNFTYEMAGHIVKYLREKYDEAVSETLPETPEDVIENQRFRDASLALDELGEEIKKTEKR